MKIGIIGAGPAGIMAALEACCSGAQVVLMDANPSIGRKLAATGSGRCNLTNTNISPSRYHSASSEFVKQALSQFGHKELLAWLKTHAIFTYATQDGWVYPITDSAANVVDLLNAQVMEAGVELHLQTLITDIQKDNDRFILHTADVQRSFSVDKVIVATGGPAYPQLGARENIYSILKKLGHTILPVLPALAPLETDMRPIHKLQGVRLDAGVTLLADDKKIGQTFGNIIFTSWGLNGPGVMDLSYLVSLHVDSRLELQVDLIHGRADTLHGLLKSKSSSSMSVLVLLESFLPVKGARWAVEGQGLPLDTPMNKLNATEINKLIGSLQNIKVNVKRTKGFRFSQLSTGGVSLHEVDSHNMQSKLIKGLYFAGEVLDVAGPCGGYNLQWAFTSGYIAGQGSITIQEV